MKPMLMKAWRMTAAEEFGVAASTIAMWLKRGKMRPKMRRESPRVIFILTSPREAFNPKKIGRPNISGIESDLKIGHTEYMRRWRLGRA